VITAAAEPRKNRGISPSPAVAARAALRVRAQTSSSRVITRRDRLETRGDGRAFRLRDV
jgi:hypothetical protein